MGFFEKEDVKILLKDEAVMNSIIEKTLEDPDVANDIASDIANNLSDELEDDPEFRRRILLAATKNQDFKNKIMKELVEDLS